MDIYSSNIEGGELDLKVAEFWEDISELTDRALTQLGIPLLPVQSKFKSPYPESGTALVTKKMDLLNRAISRAPGGSMGTSISPAARSTMLARCSAL